MIKNFEVKRLFWILWAVGNSLVVQWLRFHASKAGDFDLISCQGTRIPIYPASLVAQMLKNLPAVQETWVQSPGWEDTLEKDMATHSSILPGEFYGQRSLVGYSPWSPKELDTTE